MFPTFLIAKLRENVLFLRIISSFFREIRFMPKKINQTRIHEFLRNSVRLVCKILRFFSTKDLTSDITSLASINVKEKASFRPMSLFLKKTY